MIRAACALIIASCVGAGALWVALIGLNVSRAPAEASDAGLAFQPHPGAPLPLAAKLVDEHGHSVRLRDYFTRSPVILVLDYLRCTSLCSATLRTLVDALNGLPLEPGRDYALVAISIDPRDGPPDALKARAKYTDLLDRSGGEAGVHFLTATTSDTVHEIAEAIGFAYRYDSLLDAYIHPSGFVIAAPDGIISRYVEGVAVSARELIGAIADAEADKSQGPLARLLLLCHGQGAPLGRFTVPVLTAFTIADIAAGITLIAVFASIRRRRHG